MNESSHDPYPFGDAPASSWIAKEINMDIDWLAALFAGSWDVWLLLAGALVLCWGLVIAVLDG